MFVRPEHRGSGIASQCLDELETWATELGLKRTILETSRRLVPAIGLYSKAGYEVIPNYGSYVDLPDSICFARSLNPR